jgi:hypothetical protein
MLDNLHSMWKYALQKCMFSTSPSKNSCLSPSKELMLITFSGAELAIGWKLVSESLNQFSEGEYIGEVAEANQNDEDEDTPALFE